MSGYFHGGSSARRGRFVRRSPLQAKRLLDSRDCRTCRGEGYRVMVDSSLPRINDTACGGRCTVEVCRQCAAGVRLAARMDARSMGNAGKDEEVPF